MTRQYQSSSGFFVNEIGSTEYQTSTTAFLNETVAVGGTPFIPTVFLLASAALFVLPDTSQGMPLALRDSGAKPVFNAPFFPPSIHHPQQEWLGVPLSNRDNTFIGGGSKPFFTAPGFQTQNWPYTADTTRGIPIELRGTPPVPVFSQLTYTTPAYVWQSQDTSTGSPLNLVPRVKPVGGVSYTVTPNYPWQVVNTSTGRFAGLFPPPAQRPPGQVNNLITFTLPWQVVDTSQYSAAAYIPPFVPPPVVGPPQITSGGGGGARHQHKGYYKSIGGKVPNLEEFPLWKYIRKRLEEGISLDAALQEAAHEPWLEEERQEVAQKLEVTPQELPFVFPDLSEHLQKLIKEAQEEDEEELIFILSNLNLH